MCGIKLNLMDKRQEIEDPNGEEDNELDEQTEIEKQAWIKYISVWFNSF
jgi:hypothetical protein